MGHTVESQREIKKKSSYHTQKHFKESLNYIFSHNKLFFQKKKPFIEIEMYEDFRGKGGNHDEFHLGCVY